jgi:hypothetical protein
MSNYIMQGWLALPKGHVRLIQHDALDVRAKNPSSCLIYKKCTHET